MMDFFYRDVSEYSVQQSFSFQLCRHSLVTREAEILGISTSESVQLLDCYVGGERLVVIG